MTFHLGWTILWYNQAYLEVFGRQFFKTRCISILFMLNPAMLKQSFVVAFHLSRAKAWQI
ncbi:BBT_collapsed_G0053210.mRNA.1.CDS.1 [Saccharomyces cerevisiae]|nr:BBT_collapsed_G0053210.mRNA.1.CDS.1 [Saccharomyces cerevisiae]